MEVQKLWNEWQLEILVLLSLKLQVILVLLGNRRKYINKLWITIIVWPAYLAADFVATAALGVLMNQFICQVNLNAQLELKAFWAPFLLLHLGGPDTITAYSLEDNELWPRHLLQLLIQTGITFYISVMAWTGSYISMLTIPIMLAGLIKYGERTWVLWLASYEQRRESRKNFHKMLNFLSGVRDYSNVSGDKLLQIADALFEMAKCLFADVSYTLGQDSILQNQPEATLNPLDEISPKDAFKEVEMQLGFIYDMLYTKAMVMHTPQGIGLRFISFLLSSTVFVLFSLLHHTQYYSKVDLSVTFLLLAAAIVLELYGTLVLLLSDHTIAWLRNHNKINILKVISSLPLLRSPRWSESIGQYSLLSFCFKKKPMVFHRILKVLRIDEKMERKQYAASRPVPEDFKKWLERISIFRDILDTPDVANAVISFSRGVVTLRTLGCNELLIAGAAAVIEFQQQIIFWHVATELCYHLHHDYFAQGMDENVVLNRKMSKLISRYMLYLLAMSPDMLPGSRGYGQINFRLTCDQARKELEEFLKAEDPALNIQGTQKERRKNIKIQASKWLFERHRNSIANFDQMFGQVNGSLLSSGCKVLDVLFTHSTNNFGEEQHVRITWEAIAGVWVELLLFAASQCGGSQHAQKLRQGGEFLTHFWLLVDEMMHLGWLIKRNTNR